MILDEQISETYFHLKKCETKVVEFGDDSNQILI